MSSKPAGRPEPRPANASRLAPAILPSSPVRDRIIAATVDAIVWRGLSRFSMTEVAQAARISRQTLYRYFPSKEVLVDAVIGDFRARAEQGFFSAIKADPSPEGRLRAVAGYNIDEGERLKMEALLRAEPEFMLRFVQGYAETLAPLVGDALQPFLDAAEREHGVIIDTKLLADTLMRFRVSLFLVPGETEPEFSRRVVRALVLGVMEDPTGWSVPAATARQAGRRIGR